MSNKLNLVVGAVALTTLVVSASVRADATNAFYVAAHGGFAMTPSTTFTRSVSGSTNTSFFVRYRTGYDFGGAVGYKYNDWRVEGRVSYMRSRINRLRDNSYVNADVALSTTLRNNTRATAIMANGYYDINMGSNNVFPYVGLGVGSVNLRTYVNNTTPASLVPNSKSALAVNGILGVGYRFNPQFNVNADYTYMATRRTTFTGVTAPTNIGVGVASAANHRSRFRNHLVNLGVSYMFS